MIQSDSVISLKFCLVHDRLVHKDGWMTMTKHLSIEQRMKQYPSFDYSKHMFVLNDPQTANLIYLAIELDVSVIMLLNRAYSELFTFTKPVGSLVGAFLRDRFNATDQNKLVLSVTALE